ncbi:MAG: iron(III) transport system ATP-binding protein, partial [Glaciecola sp.]
DAGTILVHGLPMARGREAVPAEKRNIGMVFQDYALFGHMSVAENVAYGLHRMDRAERRTRVNEALELVGLQTQAERHPGVLSGGQQQRVAIARALAPRPSMLLLDEPFSNLDAAMRSTVRAEVRQILLDAEITSLIVTHDQEEALSLADRVAVMSEGQLHQVDRPADLYRSPATTFVAKFVGDADIITVRPTGPSQVTGMLGTIEISGSEVEATQVMLRPEHLDVRIDDDGNAAVVDVQFFGHDQLLTLRLGDGTLLRSRRGPNVDVRVGQRVDASYAEAAQAFDAAGRAINGDASVAA